ncbi:hypothetical protein PM082_001655 [Marasmius tenuissimus]|nr:hypothetical protein PM082_001655 [Marasmius tenuissimus]
MNPSKSNYPSSQWSGSGYGSQSGSYSPTSQYPQSPQHSTGYGGRYSQSSGYDEYGSSAPYSQSSYPASNLGQSRQSRDYMTPSQSSQTASHPQSYGQSPLQSHHPHSQSHSVADPYGSGRSRSYSHTLPYPQSSPSNSTMTHTAGQYTNQITLYPPGHPSSSSSPTQARPYACDLCALSFNRQHDLKRHRETHSGDKPYTCNGGCGKTFTRKDALKRHQLVKGCGRPEE